MEGLIGLLIQLGIWIFIFRLIKAAAQRSKQKKAANAEPKEAPAQQAVPPAPPKAAPKPAVQKPQPPVSPRLQQDYSARKAQAQKPVITPKVAAKPAAVKQPAERHVVAPSFGNSHAHMETSMTGFEECAPESAHPVAAESHDAVQEPLLQELSFSGQDVMRAILYAEILSKPKALR